MRGKTPAEDLAPLNLEIEATCRRNNTARRRRELQEGTTNQGDKGIPSSESSSSFSVNLEEPVLSTFEATIMEENRTPRVTLEDYSSSSTPKFFTSFARPDVQAANILYLHSMIQLIQGNLFHGLPSEDPYAHLATYIEICNTVKIAGVPKDVTPWDFISYKSMFNCINCVVWLYDRIEWVEVCLELVMCESLDIDVELCGILFFYVF